MRRIAVLSLLLVFFPLASCGEKDASEPASTDASGSGAPVKNVDSLPSGTIREGARTMNTGAELGATLEQQKQERNKEIE
jgi:hypothetical protein